MLDENKILELIEEMIQLQTKKVLECAQQFIPHITLEDVLQPFDYPQLECNAYFRYEEGVLAGLQATRFALLAHLTLL